MPQNEILDDFSDGHKPRLTPFQRWVRIISFVAWVTFLAGVFFDSRIFSNPITGIALIVLTVLYTFLPVPLFRSKGMSQHLVAHWVGMMMLGFVLGFFFRIESWPQSDDITLVAGFGSLIGMFVLLFIMIKKEMNRDERRFWVSMLIRFAIVIVLTSGVTVRFVQRFFF